MTPNQEKLQKRVFASVASQCNQRGYAAPVDVLIEIGALRKEKENEWRAGKIDHLERACMMNLSKLAFILKQMRLYASDHQLKLHGQTITSMERKGNADHCGSAKAAMNRSSVPMPPIMSIKNSIAQLKQEKKAKQTLDKANDLSL